MSVTYETITITIPVEQGYSFESLRSTLASHTGQEIAPSTLHDWIKDVCLLRQNGVYSSSYTTDELKCLLTWMVFRKGHKRGTAAKKFREFLLTQLENDYETDRRTTSSVA